MFIYEWGDIFTVSLQSLVQGFMGFVPALLGAIVVFIVGWILADWIGRLITQLIDAVKLDKLLASAGFDEAMNRAGYRLHVGAFIGGIVKWLIILLFLVTALKIVGLTQVSMFLGDTLMPYLQNVIIAVLILIVATVVADVLAKFVTASARAANVASASFVGHVTRYAVWIFALLIVLEKLGIVAYFGQIFFGAIMFALALGFGLAFGLGGKDAAARALDRWNSKMDK